MAFSLKSQVKCCVRDNLPSGNRSRVTILVALSALPYPYNQSSEGSASSASTMFAGWLPFEVWLGGAAGDAAAAAAAAAKPVSGTKRVKGSDADDGAKKKKK